MSSFITIDATQEVFELVLARPIVTGAGEHPWLVHLWWRVPLQGSRAVQIYVQDELYDVLLDTSSREMILMLDRTRTNRIELLAVPADDAEAIWRAQPSLLSSWQPGLSDVATVTLVRDESLPIDTRVDVELDGELIDSRMMWPNHINRSDPEAALLTGDVAGLGLGIGHLGAGRLGHGGESLRWRRDDLPEGLHDIVINALDRDGHPVTDPLMLDDVRVDDLPGPVVGLSVDQGFTLSWE